MEDEEKFEDNFDFWGEVEKSFVDPILIDEANQQFHNKYYSLINLKRYPHKNSVYQVDTDNKHPHLYEKITQEMDGYISAVDNFIDNEMIPKHTRLLINGVWFHSKTNTHNIISFYAYAAGYDYLNDLNCYPYQTAPIQISMMRECTNHNARYNKKYQTKIKLETDGIGESLVKENYILTAYIAPTKQQAIKQIIYLLSHVFNELRNKPITFTYILNLKYENEPMDIMVKILERNKNKFVSRIKLYERNKSFLTFEEDARDICFF